jgi:hypothetical protein
MRVMRMKNGGEIFYTAFPSMFIQNEKLILQKIEGEKNKWESKSENKTKGMKWAESEREGEEKMETLE